MCHGQDMRDNRSPTGVLKVRLRKVLEVQESFEKSSGAIGWV